MKSDSFPDTGSLNSLYPFSPTDTESTLAEICVRYLLMDDFRGSEQFKLSEYRFKRWRERYSEIQDRPEHPIPGVHDFLDYSAKHWAQHVRDMSYARYFPLEYLIRQLYDTSSRPFLIWFDPFWQDSTFELFWSHMVYGAHRIHPLCLAALNGHGHLLEQFLLECKGDFVPQTNLKWMRDPTCENETKAFIWSSWAGHYDICCFLLKRGARLHPDAMEAALRQGNTEIVQLILESGGDSMRRCFEHGNALEIASWSDDVGTILFLLKAGFHVDAGKGARNGPALVRACHNGYTDIVKLLLERGADVNARGSSDYGNDGALFSACQAGHLEIVEMLLEKGAEVNLPDDFDEYPLVAACTRGSVEIVKLLIEKGAHVDPREEDLRLLRSFPLGRACRSGSIEIVRIFIENGANVNATSRDGSCLALAIQGGHIDVALLLLEHGAQPNVPADKIETHDAFYKTALIAACLDHSNIAVARGNIEVVKLLLDRGADVNAKLGSEKTALTAACSVPDNIEVVELLLDRGADVNAKLGSERTALTVACSPRVNIEVINLLLRRGAHADSGAFVAATDRGDQVIMDLLREQRPDFNALSENEEGRTALEAAFSYGCVGTTYVDSHVVDYLLKIGVDNQSPNFQKTFDRALIRACVNGHSRCSKMLLDAGASPHFKDEDSVSEASHTALHAAAQRGCIQNLRLLLSRGADINALTHHKQSPLELACHRENNEALKFLLREATGNGIKMSDQACGQALLWACKHNTTETAKILLEAGVDIEYQDQQYGTALQVASKKSNLMVKLLLEYGASPHSQTTDLGCPLLLCAEAFIYYKSTAVQLDIIRMLLKYGADVNGHSGLNNSSALIEASRMGRLEVVRLLLQEGADIHAVDKYQGSALMLSVARGHVDIARVLLSHGAHINYRREFLEPVKDIYGRTIVSSWNELFDCSEPYETALQAAQANARNPDDDPMVDMLLENGATP